MGFKLVGCAECGADLIADMDDCVWDEATQKFYCSDCWDALMEERSSED